MQKKIDSSQVKKVGIWIRVSTEDQAKGESPETHEARARMYAGAKGWEIAEKYDLSGVSGKSVMNHPEAQRMLRDIRSGHISALIFSKLARLARNTRELLDFADIFREAGADLVSIQESIDTSTPSGRLFYTVIAAVATFEREELSDRLVARAFTRAKLGKYVGGKAPFGYRWEEQRGDRKLVPDENEAPIVRRMFELFAECGRKKTVARLLNEAGYRARTGEEFGHSSIGWHLTNETYRGRHRLNYSTNRDGGRSSLKPEDEWGWVDVEPLVSPELWDHVNSLLEASKTTRKPPAKRAATLFAGRVACHCGEKMYVLSNSPKYTCKACRNKIAIDTLETVFHHQLRDFFFSPEDIAKHLADADLVLKQKSELLGALQREEEKLQGESEKLYQLYLSGNLSAEGFGAKNRGIEERLAQLRDTLPRLQGECDFLRIKSLSAEEIVEEARDLYSRWPSLDFEAKRWIVENITEEIRIGDGDISIDLCYLPLTSEMKNPSSSELLANGVRTYGPSGNSGTRR